MSDEADDAVFTDVTKTPAWTTAPETIGLALGDETEDWLFEFSDAADVTWFSGPNPVDICVTYVRSDIVADLRARLSAAESRLREYEDAPVAGTVVLATPDDVYVSWSDADFPKGTELIIRPRGGKGG